MMPMTASTQRHVAQIERALDRLATHAPDAAAPTLADLASAAAMSPFHFHRIFRLLTGETVQAAIQRVQLARTLPMLEAGEPVTAAAGASGYGSSQSYARAFRATTQQSPGAVRADGRLLSEVADRLRRGDAEAPIEVTIASLDPIRLLAVRRAGDYAELNAGFHLLFEAVLAQVEPDAILGLYGVPHHDPRFTSASDCQFDCAVAVGSAGRADGPLTELEVGSGGDWLRLRHDGDYDAIHAAIDDAYALALTRFDRTVGDRPLFLHYLDDPEEVATEELRADIYLPLA